MALVVGIKHIRDGIEPQSVLGADMSVIGIIGTAEGADAGVFPLNTAVALRTNEATKRAALGASGTIVDALAGVSAQLEDVGAARCVIVRVAEGVDSFATIANIIGTEANKTGIWAFLDAPYELGLTPRLIIAPGYTSQSQSGMADVSITNAGSGGANGTFDLGFTGGAGSGGAGKFTVTDGSVTSVNITSPGVYTAAPTLDFSASAGLAGTNITVELEQLANGVCAAIPTVLDRLHANFLPEGPTSTRQAWLDWKETLPTSGRIMHPLRQDARVLDSEGDPVTKPLSPYAIALYVRRDAGTDGVPARSAANAPIYGLVGVTPSIPFSITDESSEGQEDLAANAGIVFRGDTGVDGSLTDGGFTFWGTDTLSTESEWLFASVNRMRDYLELMQVKALRTYLGKYNLTTQTIQAIINTIEQQLRALKADNFIIDYRLGFEPDQNTPEELRLGSITLMFMAEEPPVLRKITLQSRRYRDALTNLARNIAIQIGSEVAA